MKNLYLSILVVVLLLTQWGSLAHDYHVHDSAETCDYCLSAQALDNAVTPELQSFSGHSSFLTHTKKVFVTVTKSGFYNYSARAPPRFI